MIKDKTYQKTTAEIKDENELVIKAQKNHKYFSAIYDLYFLQIFKYVTKRVKSDVAAGEITSDIFAKAMFKIKGYKFKGLPFGSWLYRIASNEITNYYRNNQSDKYLCISEDQLNFLIDSSEDETASKLDLDNRIKEVLSLLTELPEKELELIEMRFFEELSFREMAEILRTTEGNARIKTHRVITKLKYVVKK